MKKTIIINCNDNPIRNERINKLIEKLLEFEFKIITINKVEQKQIMDISEMQFKKLANLLNLDITYCYDSLPAVNMFTTLDYGANLNYPSTIIDCAEQTFYYEHGLEYIYISFEAYSNLYTLPLNNFFEKNKIPTKIVNNEQDLEKVLTEILINPNIEFKKIYSKTNLPEFPKYDEILFADRVGTIDGVSAFFDVEAPFEKNMKEIIELLKYDKFLLCGVSGGNHQKTFLSGQLLDKIKESHIKGDNILAFTQFHMPEIFKNGRSVQSDQIMMAFGHSSKEKCVMQFLNFLEQRDKLPKQMYAIGDHPLDDIPMLKLVHSKGGLTGFISPYKNKDEIIKAIKDLWLYTKPSNSENFDFEIHQQQEYYKMIQNIDENWDWLKDSIYDEAKVFLKRIRK